VWFFTLKRTVLSARNGGFRAKNRRFLKQIRIFIFIKKVYYIDCQCLVFNAENKRFSPSKYNVSANIGCICSQKSLFVEFIHSILKLNKRWEYNLYYDK